jgi:hypothetical protein
VVHHEERANALQRLLRALDHVGDAARSTPPGDRMVVLVSGVIVARAGPRPSAGSPGIASSMRCSALCLPSDRDAKAPPLLLSDLNCRQKDCAGAIET